MIPMLKFVIKSTPGLVYYESNTSCMELIHIKIQLDFLVS